jgi:hypothetical protein
VADASVIPAATDERLATAHRTLIRGGAFLAESLQARAVGGRSGGDALSGPGGAKIVGNGLREMDRFLCLLLDEAARQVAPPDFDHADYSRRNNAAAKLRVFYALSGHTASGEDQLRAIGRVRACLHHCRGIVHDPAVHADLAAASSSVRPRNIEGSRLVISFDDLAAICNFYIECAAVLMRVCRADPRIP